MDEGLLNDLLECSVCLERLDTSSRVLPCQHTFCLKCLKVIVESHSELRCPECRILVSAKVEELPPNVLLMRILEGMRNNTPKKPASAAHRASRVAQLHQQAQQSANQSARSEGEKQSPPPYARAVHDYRSKEIGDLSFKKGDTILLHKRLDPYWYQGESSGRTGVFPISYVQVMVPLPAPAALCKALYDFRMSAPDEEGCLAFDKGAIISVHRRVDENWAEGRLEARLGIFPLAFVELNHAARELINSPTLNRPVPAPPSRSRNELPIQVAHRIHHMSMSTPSSGPQYQNIATMSQSQPNTHNYTPMISHTSLPIQPITSVPRHMPEPTQKQLDYIQFTNIHSKGPAIGLQSVSRINDGLDRLRSAKYENYSTKSEATYQNVRVHEHFPVTVANFNTNNSSESSSSANTPSVGVSSTTSPNTSSDTSTCESAEPSLPSSPDNGERNSTLNQGNTTQNTTTETENETQELNSIGVLSLNESSTATNTSLNVSLPTEIQNDVTNQEGTSNNEPNRLEIPSSSKAQNAVRSGPESLMNFGLGLQAALSPLHGKEAFVRAHKEKRHSLTPASHLSANQHTAQNRHSAEILATSLLDYPEQQLPSRSHDATPRSHDTVRERDRRRRSRSSECPLPATYVALYPYRPQKGDELELKKGALYTVTERCRDGWFKGHSERDSRSGVFPGNYVAHRHDKGGSGCVGAPDAPPRTDTHAPAQPQAPYPWSTGVQPAHSNKSEKAKERSKLEKTSISSGVSLMKRLAAMKKCKSPPPGYSMDNPVFEDSTASTSVENQHVHVRSGSCPTQLLGSLGHSARAHRHRPTILTDRPERPLEGPWQTQHRKSQSLDATAAKRERDRHHTQTVKERFRCIVPYPPNSEYELELKVDDIVLVYRKRGDGWYKGTLQRTGRTGLFPASFVQSCPAE